MLEVCFYRRIITKALKATRQSPLKVSRGKMLREKQVRALVQLTLRKIVTHSRVRTELTHVQHKQRGFFSPKYIDTRYLLER